MLDPQHFRGTKVIASTAKRVWERLLIPVGFGVTNCPLLLYHRHSHALVGRLSSSSSSPVP